MGENTDSNLWIAHNPLHPRQILLPAERIGAPGTSIQERSLNGPSGKIFGKRKSSHWNSVVQDTQGNHHGYVSPWRGRTEEQGLDQMERISES